MGSRLPLKNLFGRFFGRWKNTSGEVPKKEDYVDPMQLLKEVKENFKKEKFEMYKAYKDGEYLSNKEAFKTFDAELKEFAEISKEVKLDELELAADERKLASLERQEARRQRKLQKIEMKKLREYLKRPRDPFEPRTADNGLAIFEAEVDELGAFRPTVDEEEAYWILGLNPMTKYTPSHIREHHRTLILANHPDSGGNKFIIDKINDAKKILDDVFEEQFNPQLRRQRNFLREEHRRKVMAEAAIKDQEFFARISAIEKEVEAAEAENDPKKKNAEEIAELEELDFPDNPPEPQVALDQRRKPFIY